MRVSAWITLFVVGLAGGSTGAIGATGAFALEPPRAVSPGVVEGEASADSCPTFSWSGIQGARGYEIAVFELETESSSAAASAEPHLRLRQSLSGDVTSWTPPLESRFAPAAHYAWTVRALGDTPADETAADWSTPLRFRVRGAPSAAELRAALDVLERWRSAAGVPLETVSSPPSALPAPRPGGWNETAGGDAPTSQVPLDVAAIRGELVDTSGAVHGVVGITHSAAGAGVVASNASTGADLILAGGSGGASDALLRQDSLDRPSAVAESFDLRNSGAGTMNLTVDGVAVVTTATDQDTLGGLSCPDGQIAKRQAGAWVCAADQGTTYSAGNQLSLTGTTFDVLEGAGSGLDADTIDGLDATALATASHDHFGQTWGGSGTLGLKVLNSAAFSTATIFGLSTSSTGIGAGVYGAAASDNGIGLLGQASSSTGINYGVYGITSSPTGFAGYFAGRLRATGDTLLDGRLAIGTASATHSLNVGADQAVAVLDSANTPNGSVLELRNTTSTPILLGAINFNDAGNSYPGQIAYRGDGNLAFRAGGIERLRVTPDGRVRFADAGDTEWQQATVFVRARATDFYSLLAQIDSTSGSAIVGRSGGLSGYGGGVHGRSFSGSGYGVWGVAESTSGDAAGVWGQAPPPSLAGRFNGNVQITGSLSKGGGSFRIDHPLDPEHKYLSHSFVESPDMMNVYNGNVVLDETGSVWVELPDWFEALNRDFRYQLTSLGEPAMVWIGHKVAGNRFEIRGGPRLEVSWQVTGIRHDRWADANRIPLEEAKPDAEQETYLHPEAWGVEPARGVHFERLERHRRAAGIGAEPAAEAASSEAAEDGQESSDAPR
ncbi:MAG: hypothetical protein ABI689_08855 [Thermoanaerobaculia bacterium]